MNTFNTEKLNLKKEQSVLKTHNVINGFLDENSFMELGAFDTKSNVTTGYGTVDGNIVFVYCQCGTVNLEHAKKISSIYSKALEMGAPVVGFLDSNGIKIEEGLDILEAYGVIFKVMSEACGVIPQLIAVTGEALGLSSSIVELSDFSLMLSKNSKLFLQSTNTFKNANRVLTDSTNANYHSSISGLVDFSCETENEMFETLRNLLSFLPSNNLDFAVTNSNEDSINRSVDLLNNYETELIDIIKSIVDNNNILEIKKEFAPNIITCFSRMNGETVGIVANKPTVTIESIEKTIEFVTFCDAYSIPIINLTNVLGYDVLAKEQPRLIKSITKLIFTYASASVPKINIILHNAIGSAYFAFNSKHSGADIVFAWPDANVNVISEEAMKNILNIKSDTDIYEVSAKGYVDDVIYPSSTRKRIIGALDMLSTKRLLKHSKKHNSVF